MEVATNSRDNAIEESKEMDPRPQTLVALLRQEHYRKHQQEYDAPRSPAIRPKLNDHRPRHLKPQRRRINAIVVVDEDSQFDPNLVIRWVSCCASFSHWPFVVSCKTSRISQSTMRDIAMCCACTGTVNCWTSESRAVALLTWLHVKSANCTFSTHDDILWSCSVVPLFITLHDDRHAKSAFLKHSTFSRFREHPIDFTCCQWRLAFPMRFSTRLCVFPLWRGRCWQEVFLMQVHDQVMQFVQRTVRNWDTLFALIMRLRGKMAVLVTALANKNVGEFFF